MRNRLLWLALRLHPRAWRDRYGDELLALVEDADGGLGAAVDVARAGLRHRLRAAFTGGGPMHRRVHPAIAAAAGALAILVVMPTAIFVVLNVADPTVEYRGIVEPLGYPLPRFLVPVLPALALLLAVAPVLRLRIGRDPDGARFVAARVRPVPRPLLVVIGFCAAWLGVVVAYGISEFLLEALR